MAITLTAKEKVIVALVSFYGIKEAALISEISEERIRSVMAKHKKVHG